jgi:hypothetical protein
MPAEADSLADATGAVRPAPVLESLPVPYVIAAKFGPPCLIGCGATVACTVVWARSATTAGAST